MRLFYRQTYTHTQTPALIHTHVHIITRRSSCRERNARSITCCKESRQYRTYDSSCAHGSLHSPLRAVTAGREEKEEEEEEISWGIALALSPHSARETNRRCTASCNSACAVQQVRCYTTTPTFSRERYPRPYLVCTVKCVVITTSLSVKWLI